MSVDNHFGLPEEVFEIILQHLDTEDVLSCSLVCLGWRNAVNSNLIWKKLCRKNIPENRLELRTEIKRVGSSHKVFETENLPMLCVWRRRYMNDVVLKRNWKRGCYQENLIPCEPFNDLDDLETDNELLLVPKDSWPSLSHYTVFNIVDQPIKTGEIHLALSNYTPELVKFSNNILVIVLRTLMQVYVKDEDKHLKLKFLALIDRNHSETIPDTPDLTNWYKRIAPGYPYIDCDHNGKYFVALHSRWDEGDVFWCSPLHIWDLEFQTKIQEVALPMQIPGEQLKCTSFILRDNTIYTTLKYLSSTFIHSYDIEKSSYSETVLQLEGRLESRLFTGTVAIMESESEEKFILFDLRDGRMLDTLAKTRQRVMSGLWAFGNLITYAEGEDTITVTVYDSEKLHLIEKFQVESEYEGDGVNRIHIVMDDIMLIGTYGQLLIRDMKTGEILRTRLSLPANVFHFLPPDPSCSKMVVDMSEEKELAVLHFW